jgi:hypothetical protein
MFPNVRLMIAAMLASVVALVCGFGMFAVFRVSHEPFARSPAATASLRLVADNAAYSSAGLASGLPFDRRLQVAAEPSAAAITDTPEATGEQAETETAPASTTAPEPMSAAPEQASSETGEATEQPSAAVTPASDAPATSADGAPANEAANVASPSRPEATPEPTTPGAGEGAPSPDTTAVAPDQESKSPVVSMADASPAFIAAAVAVNDPHDAQPPVRERINVTGPPADDAGPSGERAHRTALKKAKRMRVVVRIRRIQRVAAVQYAPTQFSQAQYAPTTEQNFGGTQVNLPTTPSQAQYYAGGPAPVRYGRVIAGKPRAPNQRPNTATGGPFVSVTNR